MDVDSARRLHWLRAITAPILLGVVMDCGLRASEAQSSKRRAEAEAAALGPRDVRTSHILLHTDLAAREAGQLVERLETLIGLISAYWERPMQGVIECYVVRDLETFPSASMSPVGISAIRTVGGMTLMRTVSDGRRYLARSIVYANARPEVVQHEVVHAYCHHTFGRTGPVWYSEGMAEMGHYWMEGNSEVRADSREIKFLRDHSPKSLSETLSPSQVSGDSWQNYASRWALCHFLIHHPNYSAQFALLGRGLLTGRDVGFEQTYAAKARELSFEYLFFLQHIDSNYRVDLCAWDWTKKASCLRPGRMLATTVAAGRGWQPTGLAAGSGMRYEYVATGTWRIQGESGPVGADGDDQGRGRLVGAMMNDYQLGPEFELGCKGAFQRKAGGDLYLRCRSAWNALADDSGRVSVKFKAQGRGPSSHKCETKDAVADESSRN